MSHDDLSLSCYSFHCFIMQSTESMLSIALSRQKGQSCHSILKRISTFIQYQSNFEHNILYIIWILSYRNGKVGDSSTTSSFLMSSSGSLSLQIVLIENYFHITLSTTLTESERSRCRCMAWCSHGRCPPSSSRPSPSCPAPGSLEVLSSLCPPPSSRASLASSSSAARSWGSLLV